MVRLAMLLLSAAPAGAQPLHCLGLTATREGGLLVVAEVAPAGLAAQAGVLQRDVLEALVEAAPDGRGVYRPQRNTLFVNRGLGFGYGAGFTRIDSDPELALITLRRLEGGTAG